MIDLEKRSGEPAAIGHTPDQGIEAHIERSGRATAIVNVIGAEPDNGTESLLPGKMRQLERNFGIGGKLRASGPWGGLILIDKQGTDKAHRVVAQVPTRGVMIGGAGEGAPAEDEQVTAAVKVVQNDGPGRFRHHGALRQDEKTGLRIAELGSELLG